MTKRNKILLLIAAVIVVLLAIVQFYANSVAKKFIENELSVFIEEQKENYHIEVGDVKVQLLLKRFSIENVKLESLDSIPQAGNASFNLSIDKIVVKLKSFTNVFSEGILTLKSIELDQPNISLIRSTVQDSTLSGDKDTFESQQLNEVLLSMLKIQHGDLYIYEYNGEKTRMIASSSNLDLVLRDIHFRDHKEDIKDKISYSDLKLSTSELKYLKLNKHDFSIKGLRYSNNENEIGIEDFTLQNREEKSDFISQADKKGSWEHIRAKSILLRLDLTKVKESKFFFKHIDIGEFDLDFVKYQPDQDSSSLQLSEIFSRIKAPFSIDTLRIKSGKVDLSILNGKTEDSDDYALNKLTLNCFRLSNDSLYQDQHPAMEVKIKSNLWEEGFLEGRFAYQYQKQISTASVHMGAIPRSILKKIILKNKIGSLRSASLDNVFVDYSSDSSHFEGNLKIDISGVDMDYKSFESDSKWNKMTVKLKKMHLNSTFSKEKDAMLDLFIDTLSIGSPDLLISQKAKEIINKKAPPRARNKEANIIISANLIAFDNASFKYQIEGEEQPLVTIDKISLRDKGLSLDLRKKGKEVIKNMGIFNIELKTTSLYEGSLNYLTLNKTLIENSKNNIKITGLRFKNISSKENFHKSSKEGNIWNSAYIEEISLSTDLNNLFNNEFVCENMKIIRPILTHIEALDRKDLAPEIKEINNIDFPLKINNISIVDADIDFRVKTTENKEFEVFDLTKMNADIKTLSFNLNDAKSLKLDAKVKSEFYDKGRLDFDVQVDQKNKELKTSLKGKASSISLLILKNKLSVFKKLNYRDGNINAIVFDLEVQNNKVSGELDLNKIEVDKLSIGGSESGDFLTFKSEQLQVSFSKEKEAKIHISNAKVTGPELDIHSFVNTSKSDEENQKRKNLFSKKGIFDPSAFIENIRLVDGKIRQYRGESSKNLLFSFEKLEAMGKKIVFYDSSNTTLPMSVGDLDFSMQNIIVHSFPQFNLNIGRFEMNSSNKKAYLKNFSFENKNSAKDYFKTLKYRKAWMALSFPSMELDIDLYDFFSVHPHISEVRVDQVYFKNIINLELNPSDEEKPLPNRMLANASFPITIDSIKIHESKLDIQFVDAGNKHGLLQFNDINAKVSNLTTDKTKWSSNNEMTWIMDATMWKSGLMHAEVNYKLDSPTDDFTLVATMDNFEMIDTDTLTANLYDISVEAGFMTHAAIDISGNNDEASGIVQFDYDELKVNLKRKRKVVKSLEETKRVKKKDRLNESFVKNIIVNGLLSKKNMPDKANYTPYGEAYFQREKNKPIFHLMWYTTSSGLLEIVQSNVVKDIKNLNQMFKKKAKED